jgi:hypothetical protein
MKKIAILTFFKSGNFGGELQAYALQKKLRVLGYDVEVLHQLRPNNKEFVKTKNFLPIINLVDKVSKKNKINSFLSKKISSVASIVFNKRYRLRQDRFNDFEDNHINLTKKIFRSFDDLYDQKFDYDIFIVGSDQVWNYTNGFSPEPYFLTFVKNNAKKISYAASIGHSVIPDEIKGQYVNWFNNIDFISTREEQAEEIVKKLTDKEAITVLDPTFLIKKEEWLSYLPTKEIINTPYLLIYTLVESPYIFKLAREIADKKKLKIVRVISQCWTREHPDGVKNIYDAGPIEFVSLFQHASFVLTNSFHGTAFSINFNIPFFSIPRKTKKNNSRFINILNQTNLSDRLIYDGDVFPTEDKYDLDFNESNELLDMKRDFSLNFLVTSIEK